MILKLSNENYGEVIAAAVHMLQKGGIIAYPTETLYGLGAKYDITPALERLCDIKKRAEEKALPLIIGRQEQLALLTDSVSPAAADLMRRYWPGPLTLVFKARPGLSGYITSGNRVAVRIPGESFALRLAQRSGFPITATSANISGHPPADSPSKIIEYFADALDLVIDGGDMKSTEPSTIVDVSGKSIRVIRKGAVDILASR